jgi:tetratricopeptide (TPR) repeat protein
MEKSSAHKKRQKLQPKVHWSRANGYLQLEMWEQAKRELEMLPDELPWGKQKRGMMVEILQNQQSWQEMRDFTHGLRMEFPEEARWWIADAYATRRCQSLEQAREVLLEGLVHNYDDALIRYNLGCYACKLGSLGECLDFLKEAVKRDEKYKLLAMEDEDLEDVQDALREMGWGDVVV